MTKLSQHQSNEYTKMMILGDPGSGKTGGLVSLVADDYWLGIIDMDNGLDSLKQQIMHRCPDKIDNVEYRTLRDVVRITPQGRVVIGQARAYTDACEMCENWKYGDVDYGPPWKWGPKRILIIDSGTLLGQAALDWQEQMTMNKREKYDQRAVYHNAQQSIVSLMGAITSERFKTNVIVITHVRYVENDQKVTKGYPNTIGQALLTTIGLYFNSIALCETQVGGRRTITTVSTSQIDLKNPAPFAMQPRYPLETGLAEFFKVVRSTPKEAPTPKPPVRPIRPQQLTLKRI